MWMLALVLYSSAPVHASWVYKRAGLDDRRVASLLEGRARAGLTELYVSLGALPLDASDTPGRLRQLKAGGLRIEALIDGPAPDAHLARLRAYNSAQADASTRFDGVHYDFEPWIGSGQSSAWVQTLMTAYQLARTAALAAGLPLSVDISGAKMFALPSSAQARLLQAVPRIVLMQYEASPERVAKRSEALLNGASRNNASIVIALREKDFGCDVLNQLARIESDWRSSPRYAGWGLFEYEDYAQKCLR